MKKKITMFIVIVVIGLGIFFSTSGAMTSVVLTDYSVSEDNSVLAINVGVMSSMGYVRTLKVKEDSASQYITFYSTYGLNNSMGAKNEFEINVEPSCEAIYFYKGDAGDDLVLSKNKETKKWEKVR